MDIITIGSITFIIVGLAVIALLASRRDCRLQERKRKEYLERWAKLTFGKLLASFADGNPVPQQFRGIKRIRDRADAEHIRAFIDFLLAAKGRSPERMGWSWSEDEHGAGYITAYSSRLGTSVTRIAWVDLVRSKLTLPW